MKREYTLREALEPPFCPGTGSNPACRFAGSCSRDYKRNTGSHDYSRKIQLKAVRVAS